jgi:hypothetical protein
VVPPGLAAPGEPGAGGTPTLLSTQTAPVEQPALASSTRPASTAKLARQQ